MANRTENVTRKLSIFINDREVTNSLNGIQKEINRTTAVMRNLNRDSADYDKKMSDLQKTLMDLKTRQSYFKDEINGTNSALEASKNSLEGVEKRMKDIEKELRLLDATSENYNNRVAELRTEYAALQQQQEQYTDNLRLTERAQEVSKNSLAGISNEIRRVRGEMELLDSTSQNYREEVSRLQLEEAQLVQRQTQMQNEINGTTGVLQQMRNALGPVATGMLTAFSIEAVVTKTFDAIRDGFKTVVDFNQKQADLAAIMGKSRAQIRNLTADAIKYGSSTAYSASEVSVLQTELARLGKTEPQIRAMTKSILNGATAMEAELGQAAELVGGQLNAYGENADKAAKYSDILANSTNISATSFEYLQTALPKVSAVADQEGVSFEKLNAVIGTLADQNIAAETAGTGFRNILLTSAQAGKPYGEMLDKVKNSTNQTATATELFGKENATVAVILANSTDKINENTKALENSAGSAEKLAKTRMDSIQGALENFSGAWEGFILSLEKGDGFWGRLTQKAIGFGTAILDLITPQQRLSDELRTEQIELNKLVSRITSANVSNDTRKQLLIQLKQEYPDFIKNIDTEKVSNDELKAALGSVNDEYVKRIALQKSQEKIDDIVKKQGYALQRALDERERIFKMLNEAKVDYKLKVNIDYNNIEKSAAQIQKLLAAQGKSIYGLDDALGKLRVFGIAEEAYQSQINKATAAMDRQAKSLGVKKEKQKELTEEEKKAAEAEKEKTREAAKQEAQNAALEKQIQQLTFTKNRRDAAGLDTYNVEKQIYQLQQKLYKDDVEKFEEATVKLIELDKQRSDKAKEEIEKRRKEWVKSEEAYYTADREISALVKKSAEELGQWRLSEGEKQDTAIAARWDAEIEKYKDHAERKKELEAAKENEINDARAQRAEESAKRIRDIEQANEQERLQRIFTNSQYLQEFEMENQKKREIYAVEQSKLSEEEKGAQIELIKKKYAEREMQSGIALVDFYQNLKAQEVKWSELSEKQKLALVKQGLNAASELFPEGSAAWKTTKIAEAVINTRQAAIAAYQSVVGIPGVGPVLAPLAAAAAIKMGYNQVRQIINTKVQKPKKFFYGGYTGTTVKMPDQYGGVTQVDGAGNQFHAMEYAVPAWMMKKPAVARTVDWLEQVRTGKTTANDTTTATAAQATTAQTDNNSVNSAILATLIRLDNAISSGIVATQVWGYDDVKNLNTMQTDIKKSENNGKLN